MIATEVVDMDKMVAGFDPETFDPTAFAEGLMAEERAARDARTQADVRRREESPEAEQLRREILDVRTPMAWHDNRRHAYKLWLRQEREVFYRVFEEAARRGEWSEAEQSAVAMALSQVDKVVKALSDFDRVCQEERFTDRDDDRPTRSNETLRGRVVRRAANKPQEKRGEIRRKEKIKAAQERWSRCLLRLPSFGGWATVVNKFLDGDISEEAFAKLKAEMKKPLKLTDVERFGYGAARRDIRKKPKRNNKQKKRGKGKATTSARGGRK